MILNANARSLCPKINSLLDYIEEMSATVSIVTETWLTDGKSLDDDLMDIEGGTGVRLLVRNRRPGARGTSHGGVALAFKKDMLELKQIDFRNDDDYEILVGLGSLPGHSRKVIVIGAYIPPNYTQARGQGCLDYLSDLVLEIKRRYRDPFIVIGGDFNQWSVGEALADYPDISEVRVGATREDQCLDRLFCSFGERVEAFRTLEPLENEDGSKKSDHRVSYFEAELPRASSFEWITYTYRYYNEESVKKFGEWLVLQDWSAVIGARTSDEKTEVYQKMITGAIEDFFPLVTTRKKSTDLPWINWAIRKRIAKSCLLYTSPSPRDRQKSRMPSSA